MIIPFAIMAITSGNIAMLLGISAHLAVGIGLLIYIFTRLLNTTYITVDDQELSIEHRPFTVPLIAKDQYFDVRDFEQLYSKKYVSHQTNGRNIYVYGVYARLKNGEELRIIGGLKTKNKALFIEQEVEIFLGIEDTKVRDEV